MPTINFTPSDTPPDAITLPVSTPTGDAPGAVGLAAFTPTASAPGAITLPPTSGTASAPDAVALPDSTPTEDAPSAIALGSTTPTASAPQMVEAAPNVTAPTDSNMHTASLAFFGNLKADQVFGFYKSPAACVVRGVQLLAQKAPAGADVIVELVDADGISLGRSATLPAGDAVVDVTFETPLPLLNAAIVRAKIAQTGTGNNPGAYLTANLIVQLT